MLNPVAWRSIGDQDEELDRGHLDPSVALKPKGSKALMEYALTTVSSSIAPRMARVGQIHTKGSRLGAVQPAGLEAEAQLEHPLSVGFWP